MLASPDCPPQPIKPSHHVNFKDVGYPLTKALSVSVANRAGLEDCT